MQNPNQPPTEEHAPVPKYLVPAFVAGLIAWGLYLAIGAAFPDVPQQEPAPATRAADAEGGSGEGPAKSAEAVESPPAKSVFRPWRGVVVLVCSALFLAWFWGLQRLYVRRHPL